MGEAQGRPALDEKRLQQLTLTAWEMENAGDAVAAERGRGAFLRGQDALQAEIEKWSDVRHDSRSQVRIRPEAAAAVLLVHGSTGSPQDLRGLTDHLFERGYTVANILLPGHGSDEAELRGLHWRTCLHEVRLRHRILARVHGKVHVVGFSFGAALAIHLAREEEVASLVLLSAALSPRVPFWTRVLMALGLHRLPAVRRMVGWDLEVFDCMERAKPLVSRLRAPIYAAHCEDDPRIDPSSLRYLQRKARHRASRFRLLPEGGHLILESHGKGALHQEIGEFLDHR